MLALLDSIAKINFKPLLSAGIDNSGFLALQNNC
jgi:hypothetical protein